MNEEMNNINNQVQPEVVPTVPVTPEVTMATPVAPEVTPVVPMAAPVAPEVTPEVPMAAPVAPEVTPEVPMAAPVAPEVTPEVPMAAPVAPEVVEEQEKDDTANVTFDYNSLYGIDNNATNVVEEEKEEELKFKAQDFDIENRSLVGRDSSVTPEFNASVLAGNADINTKNTDKVLDEKQQDKADTRKKILYIGVITVLIIVFIKFIFPILSGYKF